MSVKQKTALIFGVLGQDGAYLSKFLLGKGYRVVGTTRDPDFTEAGKLTHLGIRDDVELCVASIVDFESVREVIARVEPSEIYHLAAQSSVKRSFEQPVETLESINLGTLNVLEAIRTLGMPIRLYTAASSECFGDTGGVPADEATAFNPRSPYAVAKSSAFWMVKNYRTAYGLFACSGLLFNHESPLRPLHYVTRKVIKGAVEAKRNGVSIELGNLEIRRDWGWAPEYVDAMWRMMQQDQADDFVIATGENHALRDFVAEAYQAVGLEWQDHVTSDGALFRPNDIENNVGNPAKAQRILGWTPQYKMRDVVRAMIAAELSRTEEQS